MPSFSRYFITAGVPPNFCKSAITYFPEGLKSPSNGVFSEMAWKSSIVRSTLAELAMASRCKTALVDPPVAITYAMAFSNAGLVMMSRGVNPERSKVFIDSPMLSHSIIFSFDTAGAEDEPGRDIPITSAAEAMVLAVYIPPQDPGPGQACRTISFLCSSFMVLLRYCPYDWKADTTSSFSGTPAQVPEPGRIVPPYTMMDGLLCLAKPIRTPGMFLSQDGIPIQAS
ncbi:hypothetical protein OGATHE_005848 [Ogataea polymorpha]|uniref:Uncharacterized protein n=1 Tax=Ogataea polymorpha TaxID=460523 RepID=A0A9P8NTY2_9ASCO|nr:hypothetical protein OGATHE_005848 [Ogataea polymorpha]